MIRGLIFDMDGTLVVNIEYHLRAFAAQAERHGYSLVRPVTSDFFGWHNFDIMKSVVPREFVDKIGLQRLSDEKEAIYRDLYSGHVKPVKGLTALLQDASDNGVSCAIGSAGIRENVEFIIDECHIRRYIAAYVCADDVTRCKPDPEIFLKACERLNLLPSECVVFEDAVSGIKAAVAAGCHAVGITTTLSADALTGVGAEFAVPDFLGLDIASLRERLEK